MTRIAALVCTILLLSCLLATHSRLSELIIIKICHTVECNPVVYPLHNVY